MDCTIFWDFDGTLVYGNQSFLQSLQEALGSIKIDRELCRAFLQSACSWYHPQRAYPERTGELWWQELLEKTEDFLKGQSVPAEQRWEICRRFRENAVRYPYRMYEDAREILTCARALGCRNYLLSNNFPELDSVLERMGIRDCFEDVFLSSRLGYEKPRKEIFLLAQEMAGNSPVIFMVGDNPEADIRGAGEVGWHTVLVHAGEKSQAVGTFQCSRLKDIKKILEQMQKGQVLF